MGYYWMMSNCIRCKQLMSFNPYKVPSIRLNPESEKEPICLVCHEALNKLRTDLGLDPWPDPLPGAYEPVDENEEMMEPLD